MIGSKIALFAFCAAAASKIWVDLVGIDVPIEQFVNSLTWGGPQ